MKAKLVKHESGYILYDEDNITIGAEPNVLSSDVFSKLSIKNCQAIERGYDLDELVKSKYPNFYNEDYEYDVEAEMLRDEYKSRGFKEGFQKALEILGDKKFSEEDMIQAYIQGTNDGAGYEGMCDYDTGNCTEAEEFSKEAEEEFIQSLKQTEWDVEVEMVAYRDGDFINDGKTHIIEVKFRPALDADGCLILKRI